MEKSTYWQDFVRQGKTDLTMEMARLLDEQGGVTPPGWLSVSWRNDAPGEREEAERKLERFRKEKSFTEEQVRVRERQTGRPKKNRAPMFQRADELKLKGLSTPSIVKILDSRRPDRLYRILLKHFKESTLK